MKFGTMRKINKRNILPAKISQSMVYNANLMQCSSISLLVINSVYNIADSHTVTSIQCHVTQFKYHTVSCIYITSILCKLPSLLSSPPHPKDQKKVGKREKMILNLIPSWGSRQQRWHSFPCQPYSGHRLHGDGVWLHQWPWCLPIWRPDLEAGSL